MIIQAFAFYLFAAILISSSLMVITARNPVHSVLFLILAFFNAAGLFVLLGAEFIAFILLIVYVGAVAVLFLFVVMMLDINFTDLRKGAMQYVPVGVLAGGVLLAELTILYGAWNTGAIQVTAALSAPIPDIGAITNTEALGRLLYTDYIYAFQASGLILLVAMIGAIILTHRNRSGVKRQKIAEQIAQKAEDVLEIKKVTSGTGG